MTLTVAGRVVLVLAALALILFLVGVAARVWAGQWDAEKVIAIAVAAPTIVALLAWRWEA
jgi:hypothetical protein